MGHGVFPRNIAVVCGAAFLYDHPGDPDALALQSRIESQGLEKTMREVSGVDSAGDFGKAVADAYRTLREKRKGWKR
jgi:hypothetical protein